jgi:hypothetical protein
MTQRKTLGLGACDLLKVNKGQLPDAGPHDEEKNDGGLAQRGAAVPQAKDSCSWPTTPSRALLQWQMTHFHISSQPAIGEAALEVLFPRAKQRTLVYRYDTPLSSLR